MGNRSTFKRYEIKYLITKEQQKQILSEMRSYMVPDPYGKSTICNLYFDTDQFLMIRRSIERPIYKEKLRLRSYGIAKPDSTVFLELKKKYESIVYKRRISLKEAQAVRYFRGGALPKQSQIANEIDYAWHFYQTLHPAVSLSYERQAFFAKDDDSFRVTFDENILWRDYDLSLCAGIYGSPLLERDCVLMEVKTADAIPLWLVRLLSEKKIYKTSFSKYGAAYQNMITKSDLTGGSRYA